MKNLANEMYNFEMDTRHQINSMTKETIIHSTNRRLIISSITIPLQRTIRDQLRWRMTELLEES